MTVRELLLANRSFRGFYQQPKSSKEQVMELVALTRLCPSSGNVQPLKYHIICDEDKCAKMVALTRWGGRMKAPRLPRPGYAPTAYVLILHDLSISPNPAAFARDVGIAALSILLGAIEMGFGGCMLGGYDGKSLMDLLQLPANLQPALLVALGKPAETIVLEDAPVGFVNRDNGYYRDGQDVHHVYKRPLEEIVV